MAKKQANFEDLCKAVLDDVENGASVRAACTIHGVKRTDFYDWKDADRERSGHYARAREGCADARFDEIGEVIRQIHSGELDPQAGRVVLDGLKWQAAKMFPDKFGERRQVELKADVSMRQDPREAFAQMKEQIEQAEAEQA